MVLSIAKGEILNCSFGNGFDRIFFAPHKKRRTFMLDFLEAMTILCFGLSWPISIRKSYISRTAKGKSLFFELFLLLGYVFGIVRKAIQTAQGSSGFVFFLSFFFYVLNLIMISIDVALYFRNIKLDKMRENA